MRNTRMITEKKHIFPLIVAAIVIGISSCSSAPTTQEQSNNTPSNNVPPASTPVSPETAPDTSVLSPTPNPEKLEAEKSQTKPPTSQSSSSTKSSSSTPEKIAAAPSSTLKRTINATLYTSDSQCQKLVPQKVELPANTPIESAVGKIIEKHDSADFNLSGYRVNLKNGVATVDFRLAPNSQRQLSSLSSCEQFALFNSVRRTLTSNPQWKVKNVRFTEKGQEIVL